MSIRTVLITGGAGFIGSHLADELLAHGYRVRALDNLTPQVHTEGRRRPAHLAKDVDLHVGDVRDRAAVRRALEGVEAVFHFAAAVGVGQSTYDVEHYTTVNNAGTAVVCEALLERPVERLVVASSMSVYGEGLYLDASGLVREASSRPFAQLRRGEWEVTDESGKRLSPMPTPETKSVSLESIYALSKHDQERMCLLLGRAYKIPTVALRFFNVYGLRQAPSNPYTGVLAVFAARLSNGDRPLVLEDGEQRRDFVSVTDVVRACRLALEREEACGKVINVGSGNAVTIVDIARRLAAVMGRRAIAPQVTGKYRIGDVRHCVADISLARRVLGYAPRAQLDEGLGELAAWLEGQVTHDRVLRARKDLEIRGLTP